MFTFQMTSTPPPLLPEIGHLEPSVFHCPYSNDNHIVTLEGTVVCTDCNTLPPLHCPNGGLPHFTESGFGCHHCDAAEAKLDEIKRMFAALDQEQFNEFLEDLQMGLIEFD